MRGHGNVGRVANDLVLMNPHLHLPPSWEGTKAQSRCGPKGTARETTAKVLKVSPVISVEALADLGAHVAQCKGVIHGLLRPLGIGSGHLVTSVVATAEVVLELRAELFWNTLVLDKDRVLAVCVAVLERLGRNVLDDPGRFLVLRSYADVKDAAALRSDNGARGSHTGRVHWGRRVLAQRQELPGHQQVCQQPMAG